MKKLLVLAALTVSLGGCAAIPAATAISAAAVGVSAMALGVTAYHDCRGDGGCRNPPLPK